MTFEEADMYVTENGTDCDESEDIDYDALRIDR